MLIDILFIASGLVFLGLGGEGLVNGSVMIAERMKLSTLLISTVVIGFGTSMPEMVVSLYAALQGSPDISLGNVVGSNICNTVLVLGVASIIYALPCNKKQIRRDVLMGVAAAVFFAFLSFAEVINRFTGLAMFMMLVSYLSYIIWVEKKKSKKEVHKEVHSESKRGYAFPAGLSIISIVALVGGAKLLVIGAVSIAKDFGISEAIIGLTIIALGTSLPELATAVMAAIKKRSDVIVGEILGSNLFNILGILGVTAFVTPIPFVGQIAKQDVWIMLSIVTLLVPLVLINKKIGRNTGIFLLSIYVAYMLWLSFSINIT